MNEVRVESAAALRNLVDTILKNLRSLKALKLPTDTWDILVIFLVVSKLDPVTVREWEDATLEGQLPTLHEFIAFLKKRADFLEKLDLHKGKASKGREQQKSFIAKSSKGFACFVCKKDHYIYTCPEFSKMTVSSRIDKARNLKLCTNCLRNNHFSKDCRASSCRKCKGKHHTLLHLEQGSDSGQGRNEPRTEPISSELTGGVTPERTDAFHSREYHENTQILLSTVRVRIADCQGTKHSCRAMLDSGSMSNFISKPFVTKLGLPKIKVNFAVSGVGQLASNLSSACDIDLYAQQGSYCTNLRCLIIPKITEGLPNLYFDSVPLNIPAHLQLADPSFNEPGEVDLLIGAGTFWNILCNGANMPIMQNTKLGWVISGPLNITEPTSRTICNFSKDHGNIQNQLARFWEIEEVSVNHFSPEEIQAEQHFLDTFRRDPNGRFIVSIPLKDSLTKLGKSKHVAMKQFLTLERKLSLNPNLKRLYLEFMREYEELSHMSKFEISNDQISFYSPHHGVLKEDSVSTKLRVVFNSSAPSSTGVSYNDLQMAGPKLQDDLICILLRFRQHRLVVSGDIAKMYRQVLVDEEFKPLQLILWRPNPDHDSIHQTVHMKFYQPPLLMTSDCFSSIWSLTQYKPGDENSIEIGIQIEGNKIVTLEGYL
ncbi:hypothetical protein NQ317_005381 [Molorchus minor]|uniref:CCHC-type domain-containing protein n=1 Tax=Molorchus minor TaxID=1323400 RepID=A0ABQ9J6Q5_9CUCU|nr:hypothetical protein NQ317_005381 [Molorchus minor]